MAAHHHVRVEATELAVELGEGERWDTEGPALGEILAVIDETRRRLRERDLTATC